MIGYYIRLALKSCLRTRGLTLLMAASIATGIAVSVVTVSLYHLLSGNPIWWKNDRLYAVTMDNWPPRSLLPAPPPGVDFSLGPSVLDYQDAMYLFASPIPERKVIMFKTRGVLTGGTARSQPVRAIARVTSADFFAMFDVPFLYGSGWSAAGDGAPEPLIVLSKAENEKLFGGRTASAGPSAGTITLSASWASSRTGCRGPNFMIRSTDRSSPPRMRTYLGAGARRSRFPPQERSTASRCPR